MPRYKHDKSGEILTFSSEDTPEEIRQQMTQFDTEYIQKQKEAGSVRAKARAMDPTGDPTLGAVTPAGQQAAAEKAEAFGASQGMDALEEFMGSQGAQTGVGAYKGMGQGEIVPPGGSQGSEANLEAETPGFLEFLGRSAAGPLVGPSGSEPGAPLEFLGSAYNPTDVTRQQRGFIRHVPAVLGGAAATALTGGAAAPGLLARMAIQSGAMGAGEAVGAAGVGEDPLEAGLMGLLFGGGGEVAGSVAGKVVAPFAKSVTGAGKRLIEKVRPRGGVVTPGQAGEHAGLDVLENIAGGIGGGARMRSTYRATEEIAEDLVWSARRDFPEANKQAMDALYDTAFAAPTRGGNKLGEELVDTTALVDLASQLKSKHPADAGVTRIGRMVDKYIKQSGQADQSIPFEAAHDLRSAINGWIREHPMDPTKTGVGRGAAKQVSKKLDSIMEDAANVSGAGETAWRTADAARKAVGKGEQIEELLMGVRKAKGKWGEYGKEMLDGPALANKLAKMKPDDIGLNPAEFGTLAEFAQALAQAQSRDPEGAGRVMVQLLQAGWVRTGLTAAAGAAVGGAAGGGPGALIGAGAGISAPFVLSRILTNPRMAKYLTTGLGGPTAVARARAIATLTAELGGHAAYTAPWDVTP